MLGTPVDFLFNNVHSFILLSYVISLGFIITVWLAQQKLVPVRLANACQLLSLVLSSIIIGLVLFAMAVDIIWLLSSEAQNLSFKSQVVFLFVWMSFVPLNACCRFVFGVLLFMVPCYVILLLLTPNGVVLTKLPALLSFVLVYSVGGLFVGVWALDYYVTLHKFSQRLKAYSKTYAQLLLSIESAKDKPALVLNVTCGLMFSMLNFVYVYSTCATVKSYITLVIIGGSIVFYTALGFGLVHYGHKVAYNYNLPVQMFLNLQKNFHRVWHQLKQDQLPNVSVSNFMVVLVLTLINTPIAYCMDPQFNVVLFNEHDALSSTSTLPKATQPQPIGEGVQFSKAAAPIVETVKPVIKPTIEFAKAQGSDVLQRVADKGKDHIATVIFTFGVGTVTGANIMANNSINDESVTSQVLHKGNTVSEEILPVINVKQVLLDQEAAAQRAELVKAKVGLGLTLSTATNEVTDDQCTVVQPGATLINSVLLEKYQVLEQQLQKQAQALCDQDHVAGKQEKLIAQQKQTILDKDQTISDLVLTNEKQKQLINKLMSQNKSTSNDNTN